jgi:peptidoglycan/LPS O-acetylase OafA/YrhL
MRGNRVNLKNVPAGAWIFASVAVLGGLGALVALSLAHADTTDYWRFLNFAWNGFQLLAVSGGVVYAGAAARNSEKAVHQTNGLLDGERKKIALDAAAAALEAYKAEQGGS